MATKLIKCKTCGADMASNAKACPQCGAKNKKPIYKKWWFYLLIVVIVIAIIGGAGSGGSNPPQASSNNTQDKEASSVSTEAASSSGENIIQSVNNTVSKSKLEEVSAPKIVEGDFGIKSIEGSLKNVSGKTLSYVQITFALYDEDGAQIGSAIANINNLTKDSVWKYSAVALTTNEWSSFEMTEIDSW